MTKNRTPTPVYLDPGMHSGLEVKGLRDPLPRLRFYLSTPEHNFGESQIRSYMKSLNYNVFFNLQAASESLAQISFCR